jgi:replicative DNA helicase
MDAQLHLSNIEAERVVLGGLMMGGHASSSVTQVLVADDFYREAHAMLFQTIMDMLAENIQVELPAVVSKLIGSKKIEKVGGTNYVANLINQTASIYNLDYYAILIKESSQKRALLKNLKEIEQKLLTEDIPLPEMFDFAESRLFDVTQSSESKDWQEISSVLGKEFVRIQNLIENRSEVSGMSTGFVDLNKLLAGFQRTDLLILAARPAMGKTALALNFMLAVAKEGVGVGMFSLEMSAGQLVTRLLCLEGKVDAGKVRTGFVSREHELPRLIQASDTLYPMPIYLDDEAGININQLRSKARRLVATNKNIGLLIVDYIGLMTGDKNVNRQEQVSEASRGLKALAKELNVCVIALSQLNRGVESRTDKRPMPSDLRESGAIEQDADIIMFIYRDEYYNPTTTSAPGVAEVIIAKQRNGATGTVKLAFIKEFTRFENLMEEGGEYL